jgi:RND superfamily putative drug exporter
VTVACVALLVAAGAPVLHGQLGGTDARVLPTSYANSRVSEALSGEFRADAASPVSIVAHAPASATSEIARYAEQLRRLPGTFSVGPPRFTGTPALRADFQAAPPQRPVASPGAWVISLVPRALPASPAARNLIARVHALRPPFPIAVAGDAPLYYDESHIVRSHFPLAVALLSLSILLVLFAMTRSLLLPIKSLVMTAVTLTATFGVLVAIFQDGHLASILQFQATGYLNQDNMIVLLFIVLGLSTDYGVFLLARIKEAHDAGADNREAIAIGLERSGRIVTAAALLFCVAVGTSAAAQVLEVKEFGIGAAVAVLIDATIIRALLVPGLMALLGSANWWAPHALKAIGRSRSPAAQPAQEGATAR